MLRFLYILFQFVILLIVATWAIQNSKPVSFIFKDVTITTSTSVLVIFLLLIIVLSLLIQRFAFFLKQSKQKYFYYRERLGYDKMPTHEEVKSFAEQLAKLLKYKFHLPNMLLFPPILLVHLYILL